MSVVRTQGQNRGSFFERVYGVVAQIPPRRVTTYGCIAAHLLAPHAARAVGFALRALPAHTSLPWHRVIGKGGRLSIQRAELPAAVQAHLLAREGVSIKSKRGVFYVHPFKRYFWYPRAGIV